MTGIGATNAHRLVKYPAGTGRGTSHYFRCSAPGCDWRPQSPAAIHGGARDQFAQHLYDLVPRRGGGGYADAESDRAQALRGGPGFPDPPE